MMKKTLFTLALLISCIALPKVFAYEIQITADSSNVLVNDTLELKCVIKNMNEIPDWPFQWYSSDENIVRIIESDSLQAVNPHLSHLPQDFYSKASILGVSTGEAILIALYKDDTIAYSVKVEPRPATGGNSNNEPGLLSEFYFKTVPSLAELGDSVIVSCFLTSDQNLDDLKLQWFTPSPEILQIYSDGILMAIDGWQNVSTRYKYYSEAFIIGKQRGVAQLWAYILSDTILTEIRIGDSIPDDTTDYFIKIIPNPLNIEKGWSKEVKVNTNFPMHTVNEILQWNVEDSTIAELLEIDTYGVIEIHGIKEGTTWLHAEIAGLEDSVLVNVFPDSVPDTMYYFNIIPDPVNIEKGLGKEVKINTNFPMHTVNEILQWNVEDSSIAELLEIDTFGAIEILGIKEGTTWLHAEIAGLKDSVLVNVFQDSIPQDTTLLIQQTMQTGTRKKLSDLFPEVNNNMRFEVNTNNNISFDMALNVYANSPGTVDIRFFNAQNELRFIGRVIVTHVDTLGVEIVKVTMISKRDVTIEFNADIVVSVDALIKYILEIQVIDKDSISSKSAELMSISDAWITEDMRTLHIVLSRDINPNESIVISCNSGLATTRDQEVNFSIEVGKTDNTSLKTTQSLNLHVFPNPVRDHVQLEADNYIESVKIYNFKGTLQNVVRPVNSNKLELSALCQGIYYIVVKDINGQTATHKIVKL